MGKEVERERDKHRAVSSEMLELTKRLKEQNKRLQKMMQEEKGQLKKTQSMAEQNRSGLKKAQEGATGLSTKRHSMCRGIVLIVFCSLLVFAGSYLVVRVF
ncbi:MAG: uncharacterized protein A8A55_0641 [Amphiamblys sp. WSBS2006]|nr:MAG: uncharacterized protein A8A55_0641 [Amphiamblys sp. WSBS2006]